MPLTGNAKTAYMRAYMRHKRAGKTPPSAATPSPEAAEPEPATVPSQTPGHVVEELRRRVVEAERAREEAVRARDIARHEHNQIRREFEEACEQRVAMRGALPQPELVGDPTRICWCSFCGERWGDYPNLRIEKSKVETMIVGGRVLTTWICSACVEKFSALIAEKRRHS